MRFTLNGESFNLIEVDKPVNKGYIILESIDFVKINSKYTKSIHVITWEDNNKISIVRKEIIYYYLTLGILYIMYYLGPI